ncbi:MAG: cell division protein ZipA [Pseudomonadales bacterium]|nr:cell division protein ZipA [Pseudomonadales bacterium]
MDFGFREWLIIVGIVLVALVLLHGIWRMWTDSDRLRVKLDKSFMSSSSLDADHNDLSLLKAELPNGGARIIKVGASSIPVASPPPNAIKKIADSALSTKMAERGSVPVSPASEQKADNNPDPKLVSKDQKKHHFLGTDDESEQPSQEHIAESAADEDRPEEKYVVINVLGEIHGQPLLESLLSLGFAYGDMNIFHCQDENGVVQFSLTNAVEPGSFDLEKIQELVTPGVTLFMRAHELEQPLACFHQMLNAGSRLAEDLACQLCDETRSEMTAQSIEDRRQSLQEYQDRRSS